MPPQRPRNELAELIKEVMRYPPPKLTREQKLGLGNPPPPPIHDLLLRAFRRTDLLEALIRGGGVDFDRSRPAYPLIHRDEAAPPDALHVFYQGDEACYAVVVDILLSPDPGKEASWDLNLALFAMDHRCDNHLLVICPNPETRRWITQTFDRMRRTNLGPVLDAEGLARRIPQAAPAIAILRAAEHQQAPDAGDALGALRALTDAINPLPPDDPWRALCLEAVELCFDPPTLEQLSDTLQRSYGDTHPSTALVQELCRAQPQPGAEAE